MTKSSEERAKNMPDRIWANPPEVQLEPEHWDSDEWASRRDHVSRPGGSVEYIRADLVAAAVREEREACAMVAEDFHHVFDVEVQPSEIAAAIRAREES